MVVVVVMEGKLTVLSFAIVCSVDWVYVYDDAIIISDTDHSNS